MNTKTSTRVVRTAAWVVLLLAVSATTLVRAEGETVSVISVDDSGYPTVTMVLSAEAEGRPIASLAAELISVTDNGVPARVEDVTRIEDAAIQTNVVIVLDVSGSMLGDKLARAKEATINLLQDLPATDQVALLSFADRPQLVSPLSFDHPALAQSIQALNASGNTALYGAVADSANVVQQAGVSRKVVVLLTDGEEYGNLSGVTREASLASAADSGAVYFVVALGEADREYLQSLADTTGGRFLDAPAPADVINGYQTISEFLRSQYVIRVTSSAPAAPLDRTMEVELKIGEARATTTFAFTSQRVLPFPTPHPSPTSAPTAVETVLLEDEDSSTGGPTVWWLSVPLLLVGGLAGGLWAFRRNNKSQVSLARDDIDLEIPERLPHSAEDLPTEAEITILHGSTGIRDVLKLPLRPVTVGSKSNCQVRLSPVPGVEEEHLRLWWKDGTMMLHQLASGAVTRVNQANVQWVSLGEHDVIEVGPYLISYRLVQNAQDGE